MTEESHLLSSISTNYETLTVETANENTDIRNIPLANEAQKIPQYIAALSATIGAFSFGTVLGWTSPATFLIGYGAYGFFVGSVQIGWIASLVLLGAAFVYLPVGYMLDRFGRKPTMLSLIVPFMIGWAFIIWAQSVEMIYIGRFLTGMASGAFCIATPLYTGEIAQKEIRGALGTLFQLMITFGILFSYAVGSFTSVFSLSLVCACIPILFAAIFVFQPESPVFLIKKGRITDARQSLCILRGLRYNIDEELNELIIREETENARTRPCRDSFCNKIAQKSLVITSGLMLFQQFSGMTAIGFYASIIFIDTDSKIPPYTSNLIIGVLQVFGTVLAAFVIDKLGRRKLLSISGIGMTISLILMGLYFNLKRKWPLNMLLNVGFLPILSLCAFVTFYSIGFGPVPWVIMGEIFPLEIKSKASAIVSFINFICCFCTTKFFLNFVDIIGQDGTFWVFAVVCGFGSLFVFFAVHETKGKTLTEIQNILANGKYAWISE